MSKKIKFTFIICLILCFVIGITFGCNKPRLTKTSSVNTSKQDTPLNSWLSNNHSSLDIQNNDDFSSFSLIDGSLKDKEVFFTAEEHGIKCNTELELKFLKYFKQKAGIKYYLQELSHSDAYFINQYLETGDEKILEALYKPLKGTFAWNKEGYEKWKKVYEFNKSLPENEKLKVIGIDIEHQPAIALKYMNSILPEKEPPKEISQLINKLKNMNEELKNINERQKIDQEIKNFSLALQKSMDTNQNMYNEYLGDSFFDFKMVNKNMLNCFEAYSDDMSFNKIRDEKMYENFAALYERLPKGKFYGQFGLNHAFQKKQTDVDWLASLMNGEKSPVKGKVLSIVYIYTNCKQMMNGDYKTIDLETLEPSTKIFDEFLKCDFTLFKLTGKDSPFEESLIWPLSNYYVGPATDGSTTDYYQFNIVIKNSKETTPLGN